MRSLATYYMEEAFEAMKIDLDDPNTKENAFYVIDRSCGIKQKNN